MIKSNQKILNMTLILLDGLICAATMIGAYLLRFANYSGAHLGLGIYLRLLVPTVPVYALLYKCWPFWARRSISPGWC